MSMTVKEFYAYECDWIGVLEGAGKTRAEAIEWLKAKAVKPRVRVKMGRQKLEKNGVIPSYWGPEARSYYFGKPAIWRHLKKHPT
jgi:hypothetical protein